MKRFLKLVHFEFERFFKIYLALIGVLVLMQVAGVIVKSKIYLNMANHVIYDEKMPLEQFLEIYGPMSFPKISQSLWMSGSISLLTVSLLIYMLFIWYRDWLGKNTFVYRLLTLPIARLTVFAAKATTIFLYVLTTIAVQIAMLIVHGQLLKWIVPDELRYDMSMMGMIRTFDYFGILFPPSFSQFLIHYGLGLVVIIAAFTVILFERSFRFKGIIFGILYVIGAGILFIFPTVLNFVLLDGGWFYPEEWAILQVIAILIVFAGSVWISHHLLNRKIRV